MTIEDLEKEDRILTIEDLEKLVADNPMDNEIIHSLYDNIIKEVANKYEPETVKKLDKIVEGIGFWYA